MERSLTRRAFMNRAGALSLAVGAGGLLQACGGSGGSSGGSTASGDLVVWDFAPTVPAAGTYADSLKRWFAQEYPKVTLKYQPQPLANYMAVVTAANAAHSGPDVIIALAGTTGILSSTFSKVAVPLQDELGRATLAPIDDKNDFTDDAGNLLGAPQTRLGFCVYWNKRLFRQAGLDPDRLGTYDELLAAARTLKARGITPFAGGNKEGYVGQFFLTTLNGGVMTPDDMVAVDRGDVPYDDPRMVHALTCLNDLVRGGYYDPGFASATLADGVNQFCTGRGAIFGGGEICDSASWRDFDRALGAGNVGVAAGLGIAQARPLFYAAGGGKGWMITKYGKNREAALAWVKRAISPAQQATLLDSGSFPANNTTSFARAPPQPRQLHDTLDGAPTFFAGREAPPEVGEALRREVSAVLVGDKSPKAALRAVQKARVEADKQ